MGQKTFLDRKLYLTAITLLLAAIPPLLVVQDRWFGHQRITEFFKPWLCASNTLCQLAIPSYFLVIAGCLIVLSILVVFLRGNAPPIFDSTSVTLESAPLATGLQQSVAVTLIIGSVVFFVVEVVISLLQWRMPHWELLLVLLVFATGWIVQDRSLAQMVKDWKVGQARLFDAILVHAASVACIVSYYAAPAALLPSLALLTLVVIHNFRTRRIPLIAWIVSLALVLYSLNLNAWWFALIGDEYAFYNTAVTVAQRPEQANIPTMLFNGTFVYDQHPFFSTLVQVGSIILFRNNHFGWRFSNIYLSALAVAFFFSFFHMFMRRSTALLAVFFLACSEYLMGFGKIGYNNLQAYFVLAILLCSAGWTVRSGRTLAFITTGLSIGLCFYVFPAALYTPPVAILLLLMYRPPRTRLDMFRWIFMGLACFMLFFPLIFQKQYWIVRFGGTFLADQTNSAGSTHAFWHITTNLIYSAFAFLYNTSEQHFVASSIIDPLTAIFVPIGAIYLLSSFRREKFAAFLVMSFGGMLLLVGASHQYDVPPMTRMFLLLPWLTLFAATGVTWLVDRLAFTTAWRLNYRWTVLVCCAAVILVNLYQAYSLSPQRMADSYQGNEVQFLRVAQDLTALPKEPDDFTSQHFIVIGDKEHSNSYLLRLLLQAYGVQLAQDQVEFIPLSPDERPDLDPDQLSEPNTFVVVDSRLQDSQLDQIADDLQNASKVGCSVKDMQGNERITLWIDHDLEQVCQSYESQ